MANLKIDRAIFDHALFKERREFSRFEAWLDLLQLALTDEKPEDSALVNGKVVRWEKGQVMASNRFLQTRWLWGAGKIDRFLTMLESSGFVHISTERGSTILTVLNSTDYEEERNADGTGAGTQTERVNDSESAGNDDDRNADGTGCIVPGAAERETERETERVNDSESAGNDDDRNAERNAERNKVYLEGSISRIKGGNKGKEKVNNPIILIHKTDAFSKAWQEWKEYRKAEWKKPYKTALSEQRALQHLNNISDGDEAEAIEILNYAIGRGWLAPFPIPENARTKHEQQQQQATKQSPGTAGTVGGIAKSKVNDFFNMEIKLPRNGQV